MVVVVVVLGGGGLSLAFTRTGSFLVIFTVHCTVKSCEGISFLFSPKIPTPPQKKQKNCGLVLESFHQPKNEYQHFLITTQK